MPRFTMLIALFLVACTPDEPIVDLDKDGVPSAEDCNDVDPSSTVRAEDADCDGVLTEEDCDDTDAERGRICMVEMPAGSFTMGCTEAQEAFCEQEEEAPAHPVTLTQAFLMATTETTQVLYVELMGSNPAEQQDCANCPVENLSFDEALAFIEALNAQEGRSDCYECKASGCALVEDYLECDGYRLPTEAEWEYAARCATDWVYAGSDDAFEVAWTAHSSTGSSHPVGSLTPNDCGLYDLSGNVWEMVNDWYNRYPSSEQVDPVGPEGGEQRVLRGGAWNLEPDHSRVSNRWDSLEERSNNVGFRVVRSLPAEP